MREKDNQIIVALDNEIEDGMSLVKNIENNPEIKEKIYGYKIGSLWILRRGLDVVEELYYDTDTDMNIILDMQKWPTDIPDIVTRQITEIVITGAISELIACPMGAGKCSLEAFVDACKDGGIRPICVLEMAHPESDTYLKPGAWMDILYNAADLGIDGFIIPATKEPREEIKTLLRTEFPNLCCELYCTGYKIQGGQAEPMRKFGVSKFIIGRYIYEDKDPLQAIQNAYNEINGKV